MNIVTPFSIWLLEKPFKMRLTRPHDEFTQISVRMACDDKRKNMPIFYDATGYLYEVEKCKSFKWINEITLE